MKRKHPLICDDLSDLPDDAEGSEGTPEGDLWFLPGPPMEDEPDYLPPGPRAEPGEAEILADWAQAEAANAAHLARVAGRLGALADRLGRGPEGCATGWP